MPRRATFLSADGVEIDATSNHLDFEMHVSYTTAGFRKLVDEGLAAEKQRKAARDADNF